MASTPAPENVRASIAQLDPLGQKVVTGLVGVMIKEPDRVREREWMCEQLTRVTLLAGEFEADTPQAGVDVVEEYLRTHTEAFLNASYLLFQRVGIDLSARAQSGFTFEDAMRQVVSYLPSEPID